MQFDSKLYSKTCKYRRHYFPKNNLHQGPSKEKKSEKAMMATWGESESNEEYEKKKGPCLVADDNQVSSPTMSTLRLLVDEQNEIVNLLSEQVKALENENGQLNHDKYSLERDIEKTEIMCLRNKDLVYGQKDKSDKLKVELKTLKNENSLLLEKVDTLTNSNIALEKKVSDFK